MALVSTVANVQFLAQELPPATGVAKVGLAGRGEDDKAEKKLSPKDPQPPYH